MGAKTPGRDLPWPDPFPCLRNRAGGGGGGSPGLTGLGMWEAPSPENEPQARCQRPTLPDGSSGLVLAGPGNRRGRSSPGPLLDGVGPPSDDAAGPRAGLPITARKSGNGRQPQRVAQLRSDTGTGYWKLVPGPPEPSGNNPLPPVPSPNSRQNPKPRRSLDSRSTGTVADLVPDGSRTQTLNQSSSPGFPDSRPASGVRAGTGVPWAPRTPGLGHAPLHHHHRHHHHHARVPCVRRFVRGRGVRPRQDVPHAGGPPALRVRARLRWAPGAPAGLRLRRRHLPRRVRAARRALPRPPGPARHVPRTLPQYVRAGWGRGLWGRGLAALWGRGLAKGQRRRIGSSAGVGRNEEKRGGVSEREAHMGCETGVRDSGRGLRVQPEGRGLGVEREWAGRAEGVWLPARPGAGPAGGTCGGLAPAPDPPPAPRSQSRART